MSEQSQTNDIPDTSRRAQAIPVRTADGALLVGWAVRQDTVVLQAGGLTGPLTVTVDGHDIEAETTHETTQSIDSWEPLTALELPVGSLQVSGESFPPHMLPPVASPTEPQTRGARISFWCLVFRGMRGC